LHNLRRDQGALFFAAWPDTDGSASKCTRRGPTFADSLAGYRTLAPARGWPPNFAVDPYQQKSFMGFANRRLGFYVFAESPDGACWAADSLTKILRNVPRA
jgi:hypothetical protein